MDDGKFVSLKNCNFPMQPPVTLRLATLDDVPALDALIAASARGLREGYSAAQVEAALGNCLGVDRQLIRDGTYFIAEIDSQMAGCGGWSKRKTLFGSDQIAGKNDALLDPRSEPARIRAFFVHPEWARRGIATAILRACEIAARESGFTRVELGATLPGLPFYRARGFTAYEQIDVPLPGGASLQVVRMGKDLGESIATPRP